MDAVGLGSHRVVTQSGDKKNKIRKSARLCSLEIYLSESTNTPYFYFFWYLFQIKLG